MRRGRRRRRRAEPEQLEEGRWEASRSPHQRPLAGKVFGRSPLAARIRRKRAPRARSVAARRSSRPAAARTAPQSTPLPPRPPPPSAWPSPCSPPHTVSTGHHRATRTLGSGPTESIYWLKLFIYFFYIPWLLFKKPIYSIMRLSHSTRS